MLSIAGSSSTPNSFATLDALVQTNTAAIITNVLVSAGGNPALGSGNVMWSSARSNVISRPNSISYTLLLARVQNTSGGVLSSIGISYDFMVEAPVVEESLGFAVYYSLTGDPSSWQPIASLSAGTDNTAGTYSKFASLNVGSWAHGAILYILWVDDNSSGAPDTALSIDNFWVGISDSCPFITTQPTNTTSLANRTIALSVSAAGPALVYQWSKVGGGAVMDGPTGSGSTISGASSASLVIFNAQTADTGDYFVTVTNLFCPTTSATAHLQINVDTEAPRFVSARAVATDPLSFVITFDEALCQSESCGYQANVYPFVWTVEDANTGETTMGDPTAAVISADGRSVTLTFQFPHTPGATYKITVADTGPGFQVTDLAGNAVADGSFVITLPTVTFQQGDANGYAGTQDAGIHSGSGIDTPDPFNAIINVDGNDGGIRQALLRFENIFGNAAGQIPLGATIRSATLTINQTDNGNPVNFHRMLVPWDQNTVTWNLLVGGLSADGVEAATAVDAVTPGLNGVVGSIQMDVTASAQAWANGQPNYGWAMLPTGGDGWRWTSADSGVATAPLLVVVYDGSLIERLPPSITVQPPATTTVFEGSTAIIPVGVATMGVTTYQWKKNGVNVPGQTNQTLRIVNVSACDDAGSYTLRVANEFGSVETTAAVLVVYDDITRPVLTRAVSTSSTTIVLSFSKLLAGSTTNTSYYTLSGGTTVSAVALSNGATNATVTLTTSARSTTTTLTITGLTDNRGCPSLINPNPTVVGITMVNIAAGAEWNTSWVYNTNNLDSTPTWKSSGFVPDVDWLTGNALFGTEINAATVAGLPGAIVTAIPPNTNTPPDFVTAYFRKSMTLPPLAGGMSYMLEHVIDDGAVFYWDGVEFGRYNMSNGPVVYATRAASIIEASQQSIALPASANAGGTHVLAIELHQGGVTTSPDIVFGAQIVAVSGPAPSLSIIHSGESSIVRWTADSHWRLVRAPALDGPYTAVEGNPFQAFIVPPAANTNNAFFQLQFNSNP